MTDDLSARLLEQVRSAGWFPEPGRALLAVSGGPDSVALLDLMHAIAGDLHLTLAVAHVDHGILPESSALGAQVAEIAARYGVPFHLRTLRLGAGTSETRARRERYRALREL